MIIAEHTPATFVSALHTHKDMEIGLCLSGSGWFYFGNKAFPVQAGDLFVVNAGVEPHIAQSDPVTPSRYLFLSFEATAFGYDQQKLLLPFVYRSDQFQNRIAASDPTAKRIGPLMRKIWKEQRKQDAAYEHIIHGLVLQICGYLYRHFGNTAAQKNWGYALQQYEYIQPALAYIKDHYREPLEAKDIAAVLALSTSRTLHLFKDALGIGFKQYVIQLRLNEARRLLATTDDAITEIALQCGFQSVAAFYHSFAKAIGITPQEYRKQTSIIAVFEKHAAAIEQLEH